MREFRKGCLIGMGIMVGILLALFACGLCSLLTP